MASLLVWDILAQALQALRRRGQAHAWLQGFFSGLVQVVASVLGQQRLW